MWVGTAWHGGWDGGIKAWGIVGLGAGEAALHHRGLVKAAERFSVNVRIARLCIVHKFCRINNLLLGRQGLFFLIYLTDLLEAF